MAVPLPLRTPSPHTVATYRHHTHARTHARTLTHAHPHASPSPSPAVSGTAEAEASQEAQFFRMEVEIVSSIGGGGHAHIVRCLGHGTLPCRCDNMRAGFLVMEQLPRGDLRRAPPARLPPSPEQCASASP